MKRILRHCSAEIPEIATNFRDTHFVEQIGLRLAEPNAEDGGRDD